jgi:hypothetical protein
MCNVQGKYDLPFYPKRGSEGLRCSETMDLYPHLLPPLPQKGFGQCGQLWGEGKTPACVVLAQKLRKFGH